MKERQNQKARKARQPVTPTPSKKQRTRYVWLNVLPDDLWVKVRRGVTISEALQEAGVELEGDCGGLGKCGKCRVRVLSSIASPSEEEEGFLSQEEVDHGVRLACRTKVNKDLVVHIGGTEADEAYFQILKASHMPVLHLEPLVAKRFIPLSPDPMYGGLSNLDRIKLVMGPEYQDLKASLHCLRTLPTMLSRDEFRGVAVLHDNCLMAWQDWEEVYSHYGLAFDLGTSTLVGKLISLVDGGEAGVVSCLNSQSKYGTNVISRLQYIKEREDGLQRLHDVLVKDLNQLTTRLLKAAELDPTDIFVAVAAGNTTMQHILLNLNPLGIAEAPFAPVLTDGVVVKATELGLKLHPESIVYVMPTKSGYIGGDLLSVILASGVSEQEDEIALGLDLGTNGEIFLGNRKRLMTCSAAAGPALEGANISYGMIARSGAIEGVIFEDGDLHYRDVGNIKPKGICGSGLVELVAVLLDLGIIDHEGFIRAPQNGVAAGLRSRIINRLGVNDFLVAPADQSYYNRPIYLTQRDVHELQFAKGAIAAGIQTLMDEMGIRLEDIDRVYLAGALGNYVSPRAAMRIGLIPNVNLEIVTPLGNAASTGASMVLLSKSYWQLANQLADSIEHIELSSRLDFNDYFIEHMNFPKESIPSSGVPQALSMPV